MVDRKYETKIVTKEESVLVSEKLFCDHCRKEIKGPYWTVMTGHHDWGDDSIDSTVKKDICSILCLNSEVENYYVLSNKSNGAYNTQYIEIEHHIRPEF